MSHLPNIFIVAPFAIAIAAIFKSVFPYFYTGSAFVVPPWLLLIIAFLFKDFWGYWYHRIQHANSFLWQIHKVHHSQKHLTVLTTFRFPIVDLLVTTAFLLPVSGATYDLNVPFWIYMAIVLRSNLQHVDTGWTYGFLGKVIVSPHFHETHHSVLPEHRDKNFSIIFPFWDHLFGTYAKRDSAQLEYGLDNEDVPESFFAQIFIPFVGWWKLLKISYGNNKRLPHNRIF